MALDAHQRRTLLAQSHALKPLLTVPAGDLSDGVVDHVRAAFAHRALLKLRVAADNAPACDAVAAALVTRVPCDLVRRIGHVIVLYRPPEEPRGATAATLGTL